MQPGDRRRNETCRRKVASGDTDLCQPCLVEEDLSVRVVVGRIVEVHVRKGVRQMREMVAVRWVLEP